MQMILSEEEKVALNKKFKESGSTLEIINRWLKYEARLLEDELDSVYADFLKKNKILDEITGDEIQKELKKM